MGKTQDDHSQLLRLRAEEALQGNLVDLEGLPKEDIHTLMHELQVHQVELTLQNEELRRVQLELEASRDQYSDLYNFAPAGYCTLSHKDHILEANKTLADLIGVSPEKLISRKLSEFVGRDDQDKYYLHRQQAFVDGYQVSEIWMVKQTGDRVYVRLESKLDHSDKTKLRVMVSDITDRKIIDDALRESDARVRSLLENSLDVAYQRNQKTDRYVYMSPVVKQVLGFSEDEMNAMGIDGVLERIHPDERQTVAARLARANEDGHAKLEYRFKHKDGQYRWLADYITVIQDLDGQPLYWSGIVRDITDLKGVENRLRSMNQELEQRVSERTKEVLELQRLLMNSEEAERAKLARELHDGIIQEIYGLSYRIARIDLSLPTEKVQEELSSINQEFLRINQILRGISIDLLPPTLFQFGLRKAIRGHIANIEQANPNLKIKLDLYEDGNSLNESLRLALYRIYQVSIMNVLRHSKANEVDIRLYREAADFKLEIQDNGIGFEIPKNWIDFAREGHMGLVSIYERSRSLGGKMEVQSQPGKGTLLRVVIPGT